MSKTGRKRPLSFSSMKKLFPSEICNSNSRYCVCCKMTLCYLKFLGTVIIIFFHYFQYPFFRGVWTRIGEKLRDPLSEFSLLSSVQVPFNTGRCGRRILGHCWLLLFNKIIQLWEKPPCQRFRPALGGSDRNAFLFLPLVDVPHQGCYHGTICQKLSLHHLRKRKHVF